MHISCISSDCNPARKYSSLKNGTIKCGFNTLLCWADEILGVVFFLVIFLVDFQNAFSWQKLSERILGRQQVERKRVNCTKAVTVGNMSK